MTKFKINILKIWKIVYILNNLNFYSLNIKLLFTNTIIKYLD